MRLLEYENRSPIVCKLFVNTNAKYASLLKTSNILAMVCMYVNNR